MPDTCVKIYIEIEYIFMSVRIDEFSNAYFSVNIIKFYCAIWDGGEFSKTESTTIMVMENF